MTTIVLVRKKNDVVVASDGQVSMGNTVIKSNANKVRKIEKRNVIAGFAGSTADASEMPSGCSTSVAWVTTQNSTTRRRTELVVDRAPLPVIRAS